MGFGSGILRLFLAVLVVCAHADIFHLGLAAVGTFFTLSGYWVGRMWLKKYSACPYPFPTFFISRCWRIFPAMVCAVLFARLWCGYDPILQLSSLALFSESTYRSLPTTWSLVAEIEFYALIPLVVPLLVVALASRLRAACALVASVIVACLAGYRLPMSGLAWLPLFAIGLAAAVYDWKPSIRLAMVSLIAWLCMIFLLPSFFSNPWLLSFAIASFAIWTATLPSSKLDQFLGHLSYTLYLVHWPVLTSVGLIGNEIVFHLGPFWMPIQFALSFFAALILLAIEWPSEFCRRKFVRWANRPRTRILVAPELASEQR